MTVLYQSNNKEDEYYTILLQTILNFKIRTFKIGSKTNTEITKHIISNSLLLQKSLQHFSILFCSFSDWLSILSLCTECKQLRIISIIYCGERPEDYNVKINELKTKIWLSNENIISILIDHVNYSKQ